MATIKKLPLETLTRIFQLADENVLGDPSQRKVALSTLAAACLVNQGWTEPAQALVWRHVFVTEPGEAKSITASAVLGKYRTVGTVLQPRVVEKDGETLRSVLERLRGTESLEFTSLFGPECAVSWLDLPSLRGAFLLSRLAA